MELLSQIFMTIIWPPNCPTFITLAKQNFSNISLWYATFPITQLTPLFRPFFEVNCTKGSPNQKMVCLHITSVSGNLHCVNSSYNWSIPTPLYGSIITWIIDNTRSCYLDYLWNTIPRPNYDSCGTQDVPNIEGWILSPQSSLIQISSISTCPMSQMSCPSYPPNTRYYTWSRIN